ncbi:MAG: redoxin family protein [Terracidiphilus sp.]|nr:redoxin family protein [Terracidiphilus sp.]
MKFEKVSGCRVSLRNLSCLLACSFLLLFAGVRCVAEEDSAHPTLAIGSPAPSFSLPGIDGKTHTLDEYKAAKVLVIVFTCDHCPTAQLYESRLKKLVEDYKGQSVSVVMIEPNDPDAVRLDELAWTDVGDGLEDMKVRAAYRHFNFPYLYDGETQAVTNAYGPKATPHVFIFDAQRKLRFQGRVDNSQRESLVKTQDTRNAIDALLADKPVPVDHTGVFGCSTKWKSKSGSRLEYLKKIEAEPVTLDSATADELKKLRANPTGKLLLVNFWATWCGPCVVEFPDLETTYRMFRGRDFDMVTVAANLPDEKPGVLKFLVKQHASGRNLLFATDDTYALQAAFDPKWESGVPYTVLLAPDGKLLYQKTGDLDIVELRRVILANLPDSDYLGHRAYWASK